MNNLTIKDELTNFLLDAVVVYEIDEDNMNKIFERTIRYVK